MSARRWAGWLAVGVLACGITVAIRHGGTRPAAASTGEQRAATAANVSNHPPASRASRPTGSPSQQVSDLSNVDQYTKTHTVLFEKMLDPTFGALTGSSGC